MADEALKNLQTYLIQLEQVEAALLLDPGNEELTKLQNDLQEVIALTKKIPELEGKAQLQSDSSTETDTSSYKWRVGDRCAAVYEGNGKHYNALIDAITDDGLAAITFEKFGTSAVAILRELTEPVAVSSHAEAEEKKKAIANEKQRKKLTEQQKAMAKKKKQKKFDRQKMIDAAHEVDKAKWVAFNSKHGKAKKLRGIAKKSIFATPESSTGRVGVGTCGIGGKPMTEFTLGEKWRKGV